MSKVIIEKSGPVKTVWMNRPEKRNALDSELLNEMIEALRAPVADSAGTVLHIGQAGARAPFGLRSELQRELSERGAGYQFRVEVNMQYRTRWFELLMVHQADHGHLPPDNAKNPPPLGRLSPA